MRYPSTVEVASIERSTKREGFQELYRKVTFDLISEGILNSQIVVWVHPAFSQSCNISTFPTETYR